VFAARQPEARGRGWGGIRFADTRTDAARLDGVTRLQLTALAPPTSKIRSVARPAEVRADVSVVAQSTGELT
jgi:hypothetical protein